MAATFADTLPSPSGSPVIGALIRVTPSGPAVVDARVVSAFTASGGTFSLSIPSDVPCLFEIPALGLRHKLTPAAGDVVTIAIAKAGQLQSPAGIDDSAVEAQNAGWLW